MILSPPPFKIPPTRPHSVLPEALPDPPRRPSGSASPCNDYQLCGSSSPSLDLLRRSAFSSLGYERVLWGLGQQVPGGRSYLQGAYRTSGGKKRSQGGVYVPRAGPKEKEKEKKPWEFSRLSPVSVH